MLQEDDNLLDDEVVISAGNNEADVLISSDLCVLLQPHISVLGHRATCCSHLLDGVRNWT